MTGEGNGTRGWKNSDRGGPPGDRVEDGPDEEGGDETDTDEETMSVTSSSQASAGRVTSQKGEGEKKNNEGGAGGLPKDPNDPTGEGNAGDS